MNSSSRARRVSRVRPARVAFLGLALLGTGACEWTTGPGDERQDQILFLSDRDAGGLTSASGQPLGDVYRMNADGSGLENLTRDPAVYTHLSPSPDGKRLAYQKYAPDDLPGSAYCNRVEVVRLDRPEKLLSEECGSMRPIWSPDGRLIAFERAMDARHGAVFVMQPDGSGRRMISDAPLQTLTGQRRMTQGACAAATGPTAGLLGWLPGGRVLFYHFVCGEATRIFEVRSDGSGVFAYGFRMALQPWWSPDGSKIALVDYDAAEGRNALFVMNDDETGVRKLTNVGNYPALPPRYGPSHRTPWSPDGRRIVFSDESRSYPEGVRSGDGLSVIDVDGTGRRALELPGLSFSGWSPGGGRILLTRVENGSGDVYVAKADGTALVNLTSHPARDWDPLWIPRGR